MRITLSLDNGKIFESFNYDDNYFYFVSLSCFINDLFDTEYIEKEELKENDF